MGYCQYSQEDLEKLLLKLLDLNDCYTQEQKDTIFVTPTAELLEKETDFLLIMEKEVRVELEERAKQTH